MPILVQFEGLDIMIDNQFTDSVIVLGFFEVHCQIAMRAK
jgi:hypothetical protein